MCFCQRVFRKFFGPSRNRPEPGDSSGLLCIPDRSAVTSDGIIDSPRGIKPDLPESDNSGQKGKHWRKNDSLGDILSVPAQKMTIQGRLHASDSGAVSAKVNVPEPTTIHCQTADSEISLRFCFFPKKN